MIYKFFCYMMLFSGPIYLTIYIVYKSLMYVEIPYWLVLSSSIIFIYRLYNFIKTGYVNGLDNHNTKKKNGIEIKWD